MNSPPTRSQPHPASLQEQMLAPRSNIHSAVPHPFTIGSSRQLERGASPKHIGQHTPGPNMLYNENRSRQIRGEPPQNVTVRFDPTSRRPHHNYVTRCHNLALHAPRRRHRRGEEQPRQKQL